jgi:hypothetical protein
MTGQCAREIVDKGEGKKYLAYQVFSTDEDAYIFPNKSAHTDRYDSRYNRVEFYVPLGRVRRAWEKLKARKSVTASLV